MLEFINPFMLIGAAAASAPIIIHLLNRRRFRVVDWAAMEFLLASNRKNFRRVRLQELILLVLRTLVLLLIAAALARPYLANSGAMLGQSQRYVVIVVDNSLSMQYDSPDGKPFEQATKFAERVLDTLRKGDVVSLVSVADTAQPVVKEASLDLKIVRSEIRKLAATQGSTNFADALRQVRDMLKQSKVAQKEVYFITDSQRTGWGKPNGDSAISGLLREVSDAANFLLVDVGSQAIENCGVTQLTAADRIVGKNKPDTAFSAVVENFGETDQKDLEVSFYVDGFRQGGTTVSIAAGGKANVSFTYTFHDAVAHTLSVRVKSDRLTPDDARCLAVDVVESAKVLLVDGKAAAPDYKTATGYLAEALYPTDANPFQRSTIYEPVTISPSEMSRQNFSDYEFIVLADVADIESTVAAELEDYVKSGGSLMVFSGGDVDAKGYNSTLYRDGASLLPAQFGGTQGDPQHKKFETLSVSPDTTHPLLKNFRNRRAAYLNTLQFYQYSKLEPAENENVGVVCSFENGDPAIVEKRFGKGKVLQFAFTANDAWTDFPRRPGFLFLVQELATYAARDRGQDRNLLVGEKFVQNLGPEALVSNITLATPNNKLDLKALPEGKGARLTFADTDTAGLYELNISRNGTARQDYFAVNTDPTESDLHRIGPEELRRLFPDFRFQYMTGTASLDTSLSQALQKSDLWKHLLIAALVLMCVESILAQRFSR